MADMAPSPLIATPPPAEIDGRSGARPVDPGTPAWPPGPARVETGAAVESEAATGTDQATGLRIGLACDKTSGPRSFGSSPAASPARRFKDLDTSASRIPPTPV